MSGRRTNWQYICNSAVVAQSRGETTYPADIDVLLDTDSELKQLRQRAEAAEARVGQLAAALEDVEHGDSGGVDGPGWCPSCGGRSPAHDEHCQLCAALDADARAAGERWQAMVEAVDAARLWRQIERDPNAHRESIREAAANIDAKLANLDRLAGEGGDE